MKNDKLDYLAIEFLKILIQQGVINDLVAKDRVDMSHVRTMPKSSLYSIDETVDNLYRDYRAIRDRLEKLHKPSE